MSELTDDLREVYRQRAESWAARASDNAEDAERVSLLHFRSGSEYFALDIRDLLRVVPFEKCAPAPDAPKRFLGVIGVSGEIWTIIDLKAVLNLGGEGSEERRGYALLLRSVNRRIGIQADALGDALSIPTDQIAPLSSQPTERNTRFLKGVTPSGIPLLEAERFISLSI
jgi:purine-binding chemotaxis protein CheW